MAGLDLSGLRIGDGREFLLIVREILVHIHRHPLAERIYDRRAHAVQTAGIGVVLIVKLSARVKLGIDDLYRRNAQRRMNVHGHAAAVVRYLAGAVLLQRDGNLGCIAVGGLVDRVVHDLPDHVMKPPGAGRADVHAGTHTHRVQPLKDRYVFRLVFLRHDVLRNEYRK